MSKSDHLIDWGENEHKTDPEHTGCLWRHADYALKKWPRCNYRKQAHDYAKDNEKHIYDIPNARSDEDYVKSRLTQIDYSYSQKTGKKKRGTKAKSPFDDGKKGWHLSTGANFTKAKIPYWHNTHHCISVGEFGDVFEEDIDKQAILKTKWNINDTQDCRNGIILPKQRWIAEILKLPTHVPPEGQQAHPEYSRKVGSGLEKVFNKLSRSDEATGHKITEKSAAGCQNALINISKQLRQQLFKQGEITPGKTIETLDFSKINWTQGI